MRKKRYFACILALHSLVSFSMDKKIKKIPTLRDLCLSHVTQKTLPRYSQPQQLLALKKKLPAKY